MTDKYDDIINLPHHVSKKHQQMSMESRAAQFAPFSALTGHGAAIRETARLTLNQIEYDNDIAEILDGKIRTILHEASEHSTVVIKYFKPDRKKSGGSYQTIRTEIKDIDNVNNIIILTDGEEIPFNQIYDINIAQSYI